MGRFALRLTEYFLLQVAHDQPNWTDLDGVLITDYVCSEWIYIPLPAGCEQRVRIVRSKLRRAHGTWQPQYFLTRLQIDQQTPAAVLHANERIGRVDGGTISPRWSVGYIQLA